MPTINKITSDAEEYKRKLADTLSKNNEGTGYIAPIEKHDKLRESEKGGN